MSNTFEISLDENFHIKSIWLNIGINSFDVSRELSEETKEEIEDVVKKKTEVLNRSQNQI
jgi:Ni,Fe-hydrogenase maturation factor